MHFILRQTKTSMRRLFTLIHIFLFIPAILLGQELSVQSFYLADKDLTANTPGTMVKDQNGEVCALIKVETTQKGFTFDVGVLGVTSIVEQPAEIWVYVPFGIRKITLQHPQLGLIRDYPIPVTVEKGRTYIMKLTSGTVKTIVEQSFSKQFLCIELNPKDAILEINGKIKPVHNGVYEELLPFGRYQYKAYCQNYHETTGLVEISDRENTHNIKVNLKAAHGNLSVTNLSQNEIAGATVYIDDKQVGVIPINDLKISSGSHSIRIIKDLYEAYNDKFIISDEEKKVISPILQPDFAEVTLETSKDADIYINGIYRSKHKWTGKLGLGSYIFESRQPGHVANKISHDIVRSDNNRTFIIEGPTPIYGSLIVSSTPSKAKVYINGTYVGETPKYLPQYIIGDYSVSVELDGYIKKTEKVSITEGNESSLVFSLEKSLAQQRPTTNKSFGPLKSHSSYPYKWQARHTVSIDEIRIRNKTKISFTDWSQIMKGHHFKIVDGSGKHFNIENIKFDSTWVTFTIDATSLKYPITIICTDESNLSFYNVDISM